MTHLIPGRGIPSGDTGQGTEVFVTESEAETERVASGVAARLRGGEVLLLSGQLGAGKTAFVRGLASGLGVDPGDVSSPTFALIHEYSGGRLVLHHADLYRLDRTGADDLGLEEVAETGGVLAIEWPDRLRRVPPGAVTVTMDAPAETTRRIRIAGLPGYSIR